jgi:hypothetical protein
MIYEITSVQTHGYLQPKDGVRYHNRINNQISSTTAKRSIGAV